MYKIRCLCILWDVTALKVKLKALIRPIHSASASLKEILADQMKLKHLVEQDFSTFALILSLIATTVTDEFLRQVL